MYQVSLIEIMFENDSVHRFLQEEFINPRSGKLLHAQDFLIYCIFQPFRHNFFLLSEKLKRELQYALIHFHQSKSIRKGTGLRRV